MAAESLREELLALPGVADAEVDESGDTPSGVRVKLSPQADARRVGVEVQRILASHGLRSRVAGDEAVPVPPEQPPPIVALPSLADEPAMGDEPGWTVFDEAPRPPPAPTTPPPMPEVVGPPAPAGARLASVRLEESRDGVAVTAVSSDGRTLTQRGAATPEAMIEAVVAATGALADGRPPGLLGVEKIQTGGTEVVAVVVERSDGSPGAGAAVVRASRAFAVGRATWSAVRDD